MGNAIVMFLRRSRSSLHRMFRSRSSLLLVTEPRDTATWITQGAKAVSSYMKNLRNYLKKAQLVD
jgi:hypothetical protein